MAISIAEKHRGQSGGSSNWKVEYVLIADDGDEVGLTPLQAADLVAETAAPEMFDSVGGFLILADVQLTDFIETAGPTYAYASAMYNPPEDGSKLGGSDTNPRGEAVYEFAYQAQSAHIYYALDTTSYGDWAPGIGDKIRVRYDGPDMIHEGIDLPGAATTNIWRWTVPKGFVTAAYESLVENLMGAVNSETFRGRPAGTMRFVQCQSSISSVGTVNLSWGFQYSPNRTGVTIAGIENVAIGGHQIWWTLDEKTLDLTANKLVLTPRAVYVQTVHPTADLNALGF